MKSESNTPFVPGGLYVQQAADGTIKFGSLTAGQELKAGRKESLQGVLTLFRSVPEVVAYGSSLNFWEYAGGGTDLFGLATPAEEPVVDEKPKRARKAKEPEAEVAEKAE